jgi:predicted enzyme related to lactoylglutathione lyase
MDRVVHFEIPADDLNRARKFYSSVFGWQIQDMPMQGGATYTMAITEPVDEKTMRPKEAGAINGALIKREKHSPAPTITVAVDSVDEYMAKIRASGGKTATPKGEVPGMGYYAYVTDSEGNVIGLWQDLTGKC